MAPLPLCTPAATAASPFSVRWGSSHHRDGTRRVYPDTWRVFGSELPLIKLLWTLVSQSVCRPVFFHLGQQPMNTTEGSHGKSVCGFLKNSHTWRVPGESPLLLPPQHLPHWGCGKQTSMIPAWAWLSELRLSEHVKSILFFLPYRHYWLSSKMR